MTICKYISYQITPKCDKTNSTPKLCYNFKMLAYDRAFFQSNI